MYNKIELRITLKILPQTKTKELNIYYEVHNVS